MVWAPLPITTGRTAGPAVATNAPPLMVDRWTDAPLSPGMRTGLRTVGPPPPAPGSVPPARDWSQQGATLRPRPPDTPWPGAASRGPAGAAQLPAQQESVLTSLWKVMAANLTPSTMVR